MAVRDDRSDVKQTTTGFRGPLMVQSLTSAKSKFLSLEVVKDLNLYSVCFGSCAASLAFCSAGELAGYIEGSIGFWDCAAGIALCEAANLEVAYENNLGPANSSVCVGNSTALNDLSGLFSSGC